MLFRSPGQIVISGTVQGVEKATELITAANGRVVPLKVGGAFHSPLMAPAKEELATAIQKVNIVEPQCPIFQNVNAQPVKNPDVIKKNLISQLTSPVRWMQSMQNMIADGATCFYEVGPGTVLQGLLRKIKHDINVESL